MRDVRETVVAAQSVVLKYIENDNMATVPDELIKKIDKAFRLKSAWFSSLDMDELAKNRKQYRIWQLCYSIYFDHWELETIRVR